MDEYMMDQVNVFPVNSGTLDQVIEIPISGLGVTAPVHIKEQARNLVGFSRVINCEAVGRDKDGTPIAVNSVGRWLFGVPNYYGNVRIVSQPDKVLIYYASDIPELAINFLYELRDSFK